MRFYLSDSTHKLSLHHHVVVVGFVKRRILSCTHQVVRRLLYRIACNL